MKKLLCTLLTLTIVILSACDSTLINDADVETTDNTNLKKEEPTEIQYGIMEASYVSYENAEELIKAADVVIIGEVTDISFIVLDIRTGFPPTEETPASDRWLNTIYDVDIITSHKGEVSDSIQVKINGGIKDYRVEEQLNLVKEMNAHYGDIAIQSGVPEIKIGETYLFTLCNSRKPEIHFYLNMVPQQSIYELSNPFEKHVLSSELENPEEYYSRSRDDYGGALISAKDVISHFGDDKWDEFWTQWQKDNPDWETRIDKAAVEQALAE